MTGNFEQHKYKLSFIIHLHQGSREADWGRGAEGCKNPFARSLVARAKRALAASGTLDLSSRTVQFAARIRKI